MTKKTILVAVYLSVIIYECRSVTPPIARPDISVTLHAIPSSPTEYALLGSMTNSWLIMDVSQRDPIPDGVFVGNIGLWKGIGFPDGLTPDLQKWKNEYTAPVDLVAIITNTSNHELRLFEEWNSWGYSNLKFVFWDGSHEYWVTKQPGVWYRNFPSWHVLAPSESFQVPVAFSDNIWSNLDQVKSNANRIVSVRALYEQFTVGFGPTNNTWLGSQSSKRYSAAEVLPRFGFRKIKAIKSEDVTIEK